jgi:hypothetical protein
MGTWTMLKENSDPRRKKSALERRVAMGLDNTVQTPKGKDIDLEEFIVGGADNDDSDDE